MKRVVSWLLILTLIFSLGSFGFAADSEYGLSLSADLQSYDLGATVKISGTTLKDNVAFPSGSVILKVIDPSQNTSFIKDLIADGAGKFMANFVLPQKSQEGKYIVSAQFAGVSKTYEFNVKAVQPFASDNSSYTGGASIQFKGVLAVNGVAVPYGDAVIKVIEKTSGSVVFVKSFIADQNGQFVVTFKSSDKANTGEYLSKLFFNGVESEIGFTVTKPAENNNGGGSTPGSNGQNGQPGQGGQTGQNGQVGQPGQNGQTGQPGQVPNPENKNPKKTSEIKPSINSGETSQASLVVSGIEVKDEKASVNIGKEEIKGLADALKNAQGEKVEMKIDLGTSGANKMEVSMPIKAIQDATGKSLSVLVETEGITLKVPMNQFKEAGETDELKLSIDKGQVNNQSLGQGVRDFGTYMVTAQTSAGSQSEVAKGMELNINVSTLKVNADKTVLVSIDTNGKMTVVGNKIKNGVLLAKVDSNVTYALVERNIQFADTKNHWASSYVDSMASKGVVLGTKNGDFVPDKKVTRAEFVSMLMKVLALETKSTDQKFTDLSASNWAAKDIATAQAYGIVKGSNGKFNPNAQITRAEMAVMISNALNLSKNTSSTASNTAETIPQWASAAIELVKSESLMTGNEGKFRPNDATTRGESVAVIYRVFNR